MQTESRGVPEYFPTVHALIENERKKQRLNHSIVSKIYKSLLASQKRASAPSSTYQKWNPTAETPEEPVKIPTVGSETSTSVYSTWNAKAIPGDRGTLPPPSPRQQQSTGSGGYMILNEQPIQPTSSPGTEPTNTTGSTDTNSRYATWNETKTK